LVGSISDFWILTTALRYLKSGLSATSCGGDIEVQ
jgi:hypothetical protein